MFTKISEKRKVDKIRKRVMGSIVSANTFESGRLIQLEDDIVELAGNDSHKVKQFLSNLESDLNVRIPYDKDIFLQDYNTILAISGYFINELTKREVRDSQVPVQEDKSFFHYLLYSPWYVLKYITLFLWWTIKYLSIALWWVIKLPFRIIGWILRHTIFVIWWEN